MAVLTDKQLSAQIRNWQKKKILGPTYGIRTDQEFRGRSPIEIGEHSYTVTECRSDLEAREQINGSPDRRLVMLFRVGYEQLGDDLLARLAKERLLSVDAKQSLLELFQASSVDPRILAHPKLVDALVSAAAERGGVVSPIGVLDTDLAWSVLLDQRDWIHGRPDLITLLCWSLEEDRWGKIRRLEPELRKAFFGWVEEHSGETARFMDAAEASGHAETLVPIGLALGILFQNEATRQNERLEGRVRIENYLAKQKINAVAAMAWHLAAVAVVKDLPILERIAIGHRLDRLLGAVKIEALAIDSDFSAAGFSARMQAFATVLQRHGRRKPEQADGDLGLAYRALRTHTLAQDPRHEGRLQRAEMGIRLALFLKRQDGAPGHPASFETALDAYLQEGSYVDRARFALFGGDPLDQELSQTYHLLARQAGKIRQEQQRHFGSLLASWCETGGQGKLLPVENVIAEVLAPLAKVRPVLLLVLDGMSAPVFHELMEDFTRRAWQPIARAGDGFVRPVVAALPTVTDISRKALFSGTLDVQDKRGEAVAFRDHPLLAGAAGKSKPRLFLKGDLASPDQSFLNEEVREAIATPSQRVVSVLLNVIDDQLGAGDQLDVPWHIHSIRYLEAILEAAAQAGRVIVLTSDHGHVPDLNQTTKKAEDTGGGDRYRKAGGQAAGEAELFLRGARIQAATGSGEIVAACEETIRYGSKKAGYHGGASDLEVVIPLAVLSTAGTAPEGWEEMDASVPAWWRWQECLGPASAMAAKSSPRGSRIKRTKPLAPPVEELPLFTVSSVLTAPAVATPDAWMSALVSSGVYREQVRSMGKLAPQEKQVLAFLEAMDRRGNSVLLSTLAVDLGLPLYRVRSLLSSLGRLFNVDGYAVLEEDRTSETLRLDHKLLTQQFDLSAA